MTSDRVLGILAVLMGAGMAAMSWGYVAQVEYEPVGPRAFPLLLAGLIALCGLFVVLYAVLFQLLGFVIATALMSIPVGRIFGGTMKQSVLTGIGMGLVLFVVFDTLLDVVLPAGILKPLFTAIGI